MSTDALDPLRTMACRRLWDLLEIDPDSPTGQRIEQSLIAPARSMLERTGKRFRGRLVELCWQLGGGTTACPDPLPLLIELIHAGSLIVDDIEDDSEERRGLLTVHRLHGVPLALNAGNWLYFWAIELLFELDLETAVCHELMTRIARMLVRGHAGQALDLSKDVLEIERDAVGAHVQTMSRLKTGSFMGLAAVAGSVAAGAPRQVSDAAIAFGTSLGTALQMLDDLGNLSGAGPEAKRYEDLRHGRVNWPWAWVAETRPAPVWDQAQQRLAAVREGREPVAELAAFLLDEIGTHGRERVHAFLGDAFATLRAAVGDQPVLADFHAEMVRLEQSYG